MACAYTIDGKTYSLPEFKAFLVNGGLDRLFPDGKYPFVVPGVDGMRPAKLPEKINIDGVERWTVNSEGKPIAQDEESIRNFYRWFGESKVVDDQGRPLVVYHGSPTGGFTIFDRKSALKDAKSNSREAADNGLGFWFTPQLKIAESHRDKDKGWSPAWMTPEGEVFQVYLRMKNPFSPSETKRLADILSVDNSKYDGVIYDDLQEYVVFDPEQIKSAIGNTGQFSPTNPDIRYSKSPKLSGIPTNNLQKMVDSIAGEYKGLPAVHVLENISQAPERLQAEVARQGASNTVEGAMHGGEIYLFADNLSSIERAEFVLAEHEVTHIGLRGILGDALMAEMNKLYRDNARIRKLATEYQKQSPVSNAVAVEEVLADMTAEELTGLKGWRGIVQKMADWFRAHGFTRVADMLAGYQNQSDLYAAELVKSARNYVKSGGDRIFTTESRLAAAWHGSPYDHDKFSTKHIGTGEGALAYGWGLYFAGSKDVAEYYKKSLSNERGFSFGAYDKLDRESVSKLIERRFGKDVLDKTIRPSGVADRVMDDLIAGNKNNPYPKNSQRYEMYEDIFSRLSWNGNTGKLYQVELAPNEDEYLLWDKPLSEQSDKVKKFLKGYVYDPSRIFKKYGGVNGEPLGSGLYKSISEETHGWAGGIANGTDEGASKFLHSLGIRGIKYLDGSSRGKGDGNYNYVIFSDEDISITTKLSRGNPIQKAKAKLNALRLSPEDIDTWIYKLQDKYVDLKRIREHIEKIGGTINDLNDAYEAETRYHGRMAKRTKDFLDGELKPLLGGLRSANITVEEFEQFLHARHAPEANAEMAKRNPNQSEIDAGQQAAKDAVKDLRLQLDKAKKNGSSTKDLEHSLAVAQKELSNWNQAQAFKGTEAERLALSGMSDAESKAIIDGLSPAKRLKMDQLAEKVDAINAGTLSMLEQYGLMSRESLDNWRKAYQYYVPLHRDEAHPDSASHPIGQGFSTRGDAARQRTGSTAKVTHILSHIAMQREVAITRGEKNNVMKSLYLMVRQNPLPEFWSTEIPKQSYIDSETGFVRSGVDPLYKQRPDVLMLRVAGKDMAIVFKEHNPQAIRLAAALKNLDIDQLHGFFAAAAPITRYFASISTQFNPIFGLVNLIRDSQTAALNLESTVLAGTQKQVGQEAWNLFKAVSKNGFRMPSGGPWAAIYDDFQNVGGQTGYRDLYLTAKDRAKAIDKQLKRLELDWEKARQDGKYSKAAHDGIMQLWNMAGDWLSDYNEAFENVMRVAAYKVAVERGMSKQKAAVLAKELTTNFNRKGQLSRDIGSLYAFFNASVQGTARIYKTLKSQAGQKIIAGGIAIGAINALIGFMVMGGGDGDDDEWSKIPEFVKEKNLIIPLSHDQYATIPMPLGFHVLHNAGRLMAEGLFGGGRYLDNIAGRMLVTLADAMNPLGGGNNIALTVTPTFADPLVSLGMNKDAFGKRIYKEDLSEMDPTPGFNRTRSSTSDFWKWLAEGINSATGGDDYSPGAWSPTPEQFSYVIGQLTGGVGREMIKTADTLSAVANNDELPAYKVPLASRFYGNTRGQAGQADEYYDNLRDSNIIENGLKGRLRDGKDVTEFEEKNPRAWDIAIEGNVANKRVTKLRNRLEYLKSTDAPKDKINSVNDEITQVMMEFNKTMRELKD